MNIRIKITRDLIERSTQKHARLCFIANAVREQVVGASSVHVTAERIKFNLDGVRHTMDMPPLPRKELLVFDDDKSLVKLFTFRIQRTYTRPVEKRPDATKRGKTKKRRSTSREVSVCVRRYHGLTTLNQKAA